MRTYAEHTVLRFLLGVSRLGLRPGPLIRFIQGWLLLGLIFAVLLLRLVFGSTLTYPLAKLSHAPAQGTGKVRWALSHEDDEGFDAAKVLTNWAQKRERGVWSGKPKPFPTRQDLNGKLAEALARYWSENPHELAALLDRVEASLNGRS